MKLSCCFIDIDGEHNFDTEPGIKRLIDAYSVAGFDGIDFNVGLEAYRTDTYSADFYKEIKEYAADKGISFFQTHTPYPTAFSDGQTSRPPHR